MKECLFCKIVRGEVPSTKEYEDEEILVFRDIHPKADIHFLIVPKEHLAEFADLKDMRLWTRMSEVAKELIEKHHLRESGYRLVNNGAGAALIEHLHLHLLGNVPHTRDL
ncbi:MAG: HIT domain-containing protein [Patescibacteria group bacterium]